MPFVTREVCCSCCGQSWIARYPEGADELECPNCGYMDPVLPDDEDE